MEYVFVIFCLGLMVTIVVGKGLLMANDFAAADEMDAESKEDQGKIPGNP